jgi:hypothetical protein
MLTKGKNFEKPDLILQQPIKHLLSSNRLLRNSLNILFFMIQFNVIYADSGMTHTLTGRSSHKSMSPGG